jgi:hypothetical protein
MVKGSKNKKQKPKKDMGPTVTGGGKSKTKDKKKMVKKKKVVTK